MNNKYTCAGRSHPMAVFLLQISLSLLFFCSSCGQQGTAPAGNKDPAAAGKDADSTAADAPGTPVTVETVGHDILRDSIELNAVSAFLQKSYVKANANGYLQSANVYPGKYVETGQPMFTLKTKEAQTIGNAVRILDSTLKFSGVNQIRAGQHGYITQLNHQSGDYVQDGEQLAVISDKSSFVFLLDLPYELRPFVLRQSSVLVILPDGEKLNGRIGAVMPTVDSVSQTQNVVINVSTTHAIPENLIAKVKILRSAHNITQSLSRAALLTNDAGTECWVMKLIDSATAVKVPVKKGVGTKDRVEILSPTFAGSDRILITGNYGLPDTAKIKIEQP